jgi:hypothetical protein
VLAREMQRAGAGIRSLAEPCLDTPSDFAEIVFAILGVTAKLERCRILERTARGRADAKTKGRGEIRTQAEAHAAPAARSAGADRGRRDAAQRCPQLQRPSGDDFEVGSTLRFRADGECRPADGLLFGWETIPSLPGARIG